MPFRDDDKRRKYYRELMRRRRAGLPPPPKPVPEPNYPRIDREIAGWIKQPRYRPPWADAVLAAKDKLDLTTDEGARELARVYRDEQRKHNAERRQQRAQRKIERAEEERREAEERELSRRRCNLCGKVQPPKRVLLSDGFFNICERCITRLANKLATVRRQRDRKQRR